MSEAIEIRLRRARSWWRKARKAAEHADLDAQFVFLWIAFNAFYGTPRYQRRHDDTYSGEVADFLAFLDEAERLSRGRFDACLGRVESHVREVLLSPFLNIECWRQWDRQGSAIVRNVVPVPATHTTKCIVSAAYSCSYTPCGTKSYMGLQPTEGNEIESH